MAATSTGKHGETGVSLSVEQRDPVCTVIINAPLSEIQSLHHVLGELTGTHSMKTFSVYCALDDALDEALRELEKS